MNRNKSFLPCLILVIVALFVLLLTAIGLWGLVSVQLEVESTFGKAHPTLDTMQRMRLEFILYANKDRLLTPFNPQGQPQSFEVSSNEKTQTILLRLMQEDLISDPEALQALMQYLGYDLQIQTGEHQLSSAMSPYQIAKALIDPYNLLIPFSLLAGWRNEEVAVALEASGMRFSAQEFLNASNQSLAYYLPDRQYATQIDTLQGFLFPDTYRIQKTATEDDLLRQFTQNFDAKVPDDIARKFEQQGLTFYEGVILASIVQRESVVDEEMPLIASVFLNRLRAQMKLDSDATVQFALGYNKGQNSWWTNPLTKDAFSLDSPYNTYLYKGLPPTPICNPGLSALLAVAEAPSSDYFYFRAACDGSGHHLFAITYAEHLNNACP